MSDAQPLREIRLTFLDGTTKLITLPTEGEQSAGFYRKAYTWEAKEGAEGLGKWGGQIITHTVFWSERKVNDDVPTRKAQD